MAASRGRTEFVELLLASNADPTLGLSDGTIPAEMVSTDRRLANLLMNAAEDWQRRAGDAAAPAAPAEAPAVASDDARPGMRV